MTTTGSTAAPRGRRFPVPATGDRVVGGVAGGIAHEIQVDPVVVRLAFVVLATAAGVGVVLYGVAWAAMAVTRRRRADEEFAPTPAYHAGTMPQRLFALGLVVYGILKFVSAVGVGFIGSLVWPVALVGAGLAVARAQGLDFAAPGRMLVADNDRSAFLLRVVGGFVLVAAGIVLAVSLNFSLRTAWDTLLVVAVVLAGVGVVFGPWVVALVDDLTAERRARIRADERAEVAAHLHDSVLQTLSLIQRRADDPQVVGLARRQERELRSWLYGRRADVAGNSFRDALEAELADVEGLHVVPIEVVVVGDGPLDDVHRALLAATREAATNAVVHSGAGRVDVYAEIGAEHTEVFVRDTGVGFDPEAVPPHRRGIAESIRGRLDRVDGRVVITSSLGQGTEVELRVKGGRR